VVLEIGIGRSPHHAIEAIAMSPGERHRQPRAVAESEETDALRLHRAA
jgi:hypothetical protein